jgi:Zn-dependent protease
MEIDLPVGIFIAVSLVVAVILHELMHGLVADRLGDPTAREAGRISLNPVRHIDPVGTILLPGALIVLGSPFVIGYAKPVPVRSSRLRNPRVHMLLVSLAGPATNVVLAVIGGLTLRLISPTSLRLAQFLLFWTLTNLFLAVFNLLPLPPLDGSQLIATLLPGRLRNAYMAFGRYSFLLLFLILWGVPAILDQVRELVIWLFRLLAG